MKPFCILMALVGISAPLATAGPLSGCVSRPTGGFTCDLFEENANGDFSEIGWVVTLPESTFPGANVPILEHPTIDPNNPANWSDIVVFTATTAQLLSDGCNSGIEGDVSCFPTTPTSVPVIETAPITTFLTVNGVEIFWRIHEDTGDTVDISEPASAALLSFGLMGLVLRCLQAHGFRQTSSVRRRIKGFAQSPVLGRF